MDNQTKVVFALLALIAVLAVVFVLKVTGVIKPAKNNILIEEEAQERQLDETEKIVTDYYDNLNKTRKISRAALKITEVVSTIIAFVLSMVVSIGIGKLYKKLSMPNWCAVMCYIFPIISITRAIPIIGIFISIALLILEIATFAYYFESVGMSKAWAILPVASLLLYIIAISTMFSGGIFATTAETSGGFFFAILALMLLLVFAIAYIIADVKVGNLLEMSSGFIVGMVLLPVIFKPILGYMHKTRKSMHNIEEIYKVQEKEQESEIETE